MSSGRIISSAGTDPFTKSVMSLSTKPGASATDLLAEHGLPPIDDDAPFGEVIYVSAELR